MLDTQDRYSDDLFGEKEHHEKAVENKGFKTVENKMYTFNQKKITKWRQWRQ